MLSPRRTKFRKQQKGRVRGIAGRGQLAGDPAGEHELTIPGVDFASR